MINLKIFNRAKSFKIQKIIIIQKYARGYLQRLNFKAIIFKFKNEKLFVLK